MDYPSLHNANYRVFNIVLYMFTGCRNNVELYVYKAQRLIVGSRASGNTSPAIPSYAASRPPPSGSGIQDAGPEIQEYGV